MGIETFPEIENFQHLPRQIIVKGGTSSYDTEHGAKLQGIVINNIGQPVRELRVHAVVFNEKKIPLFNSTALADPPQIPQGGISTFSVQFKDYPKEITDYYLYTDWKFDDRS